MTMFHETKPNPDVASPRTPTDVYDATVALLEALCAVSSPTGDIDGLERVMALYADALRDRGLEVERLDSMPPGASGDRDEPMMIARRPGALGASRHGARPTGTGLVLIGHLDTVLDALPPRREGSTLHAIGSADMKGGMATLIGALALLDRRGQAPPDDLEVLVVPDEEVLGPYTRYAVEHLAAGARGLWSLEPGKRLGDRRETVVIGRRGLFNWQLEIRGRGAHAGSSYWHGRSALAAAAGWSAEATALSRPGDGPTVNVARLVAGESRFAEDPCRDPSLLGSSRQRNVVPALARAEGEARYLAPVDGPRLIADLEALGRRIAEAHEVEVDFTVEKIVAPMPVTDAGRALAARAGDLARDLDIDLEVEETRGGLSFPNLLPTGSPTVAIDGLGPAGGGMHTPEEWVDLESLDRRVRLLADLLASEIA